MDVFIAISVMLFISHIRKKLKEWLKSDDAEIKKEKSLGIGASKVLGTFLGV